MIEGIAHVRRSSSSGLSAPKYQVKIAGVNDGKWFDWDNVPSHIMLKTVRSGGTSAAVSHNGKPPKRLFGQSLIIHWLE